MSTRKDTATRELFGEQHLVCVFAAQSVRGVDQRRYDLAFGCEVRQCHFLVPCQIAHIQNVNLWKDTSTSAHCEFSSFVPEPQTALFQPAFCYMGREQERRGLG
jgi:hypothetical protein